MENRFSTQLLKVRVCYKLPPVTRMSETAMVSSIFHDKTIKPVWREKTRVAVCRERGLSQRERPETSRLQEGGNAFRLPRRTVSLTVASAAVLISPEGDNASHLKITRDTHPLRLSTTTGAPSRMTVWPDATPRPSGRGVRQHQLYFLPACGNSFPARGGLPLGCWFRLRRLGGAATASRDQRCDSANQ